MNNNLKNQRDLYSRYIQTTTERDKPKPPEPKPEPKKKPEDSSWVITTIVT